MAPQSNAIFRSGLILTLTLCSLCAQPTLQLAQTMCGTDSITATFQLPAAVLSDAIVELRSDPSIVQFTDAGKNPISSIIVKQNSKSAQFLVVTTGINPFQAPQDVTVTADGGTLGSANAVVTIQGVKSLTLQPASVCGGSNAVATIQLCQAAPSPVTLSFSSQGSGTPEQVTIDEGQSSAAFNVVTQPGATGSISVEAFSAFGNVTSQLTLSSFVSSVTPPKNLCPGGSGVVSVSLCGPAPPQGLSLSLSSNPSFVLGMPSSVDIAPGATSATFPVTAPTNVTPTSVVITADAGSSGIQTGTVSVGGPISVQLNPNLVCGGVAAGGTSQGTVQVCQAASSDLSVLLSASGPATVDMPILTIPANST